MNLEHSTSSWAVRLWTAVALGAMVCPFVAGAQPAATTPAETSTATTLPPAKDVLARFIKELGGAAVYEKIDSQHIKGKLQMAGQGIAGDLEVFARRPDKALMKVTVPGIGELVQGFDGKVGWSLNPITGPMLLEGKMLEELREQASFDAELHKESRFKSMENLEKTLFDGRPCYKLKLVRNSGKEVTEFFDVQSGLLVGASEVQDTPLGEIAVTASVSDYKKFGDALFATKLSQKVGPLSQIMTIESMQFNAVQESVFDLPPAIKALLK